MPEKIKALRDLEISRLKPSQVQLSHQIEVGTERISEIFAPGSQACICECICNCICDCICDCICQLDIDFTASTKIPVRAVYDVVYELAEPADFKYGEQSFSQKRMVLEMDPKIMANLKEKENLIEIETMKNGAKRYLLKGAMNRRHCR